MRLPVTRANPAKNHSAKVFMESAVTSSVSSSIIPSLTEAINRRKSLIVARSRGGALPEDSALLWYERHRQRSACRKAPRPHHEYVSRQELPICSIQSVSTTEDRSSQLIRSLFIALQSTVLIFEGLWYVGGAVPLAVLGPVCSLLVAFGDSFLP